MARHNISIVHWYPELEKHRCGYCKQTNSNCSYGMWAESLTVEDYQFLIDRGWRRSGKYCYKPVMDLTCCPLYTIRCDAMHFKPTKSQKKIIKRVNRYLSDAIEDKNHVDTDVCSEDMITGNEEVVREKPETQIDLDKIETNINLIINSNNDVAATSSNLEIKPKPKQHKMSISETQVSSKEIKAGKGADPNKPPCKKAKLVRFERKQQKMAAKGLSLAVPAQSNQGKSLEEFIDDVSESPAHRLKVCLVRTGGNGKDWTQIRNEEYQVYRKYQMRVHNDPPDKCSERQFTNFLFESPLQVELKQMHVKEASYKASAELFAKYQMFVHDESPDECNCSTFNEFLVDSPLKHINDPNGPPNGYGSFHQQYWLDDKLIAVGVIDILPKCISSVYFFYDPDYRHLTLGTYGSLRELYFVRQLQTTVPAIKYYYMGFYIHSCPKMRYKANLFPSFLLCPETYNWFPIEQCVPKLDKEKYSRLNEDIDAIDKDGCNSPSDLDKLKILIGYKGCVPYKFFKEKIPDQEEDFRRFGNLIGKSCVPRIVVVARNANF